MRYPAATVLALLTTLQAGACERTPIGSRDDDHKAGSETARAHEDHHEGEPSILSLSKEAVARSGIRIDTARSIPAAGGFEVPAEVHAEPDRVAHVSSVVSGQIASVRASVGDRVKAKQTLALIRSVALGQARAQATRAQANVEVAEANLRRQEELRKEGIGAQRKHQEALAELRRAQAEQSAATRALEVYGRGGRGSEIALRSPIAGRVVSRHATVGEVVGPGDVLFKVTDISRVWAVGRVYQQNASKVREGAHAVLTLQSHPGRTFSGTVDYVAPALDERTRTLPVRMTLDNPDGVLRPGSFGTLSISAIGGAEALSAAVVPNALQRVGNHTVVFVPGDQEGEFRAVRVVVTGRRAGLAALERGLAIGQRYVAEGAFVLKSELMRSDLGEGHAH